MSEKSFSYLHAIDDEEYEILKLLVKGRFSRPIKERTRKEKSTVIKFWRNKRKFEVREDSKLYFEGKEVVTKSNLKKIIDKTIGECQTKTPKKLCQQVASSYAGFSSRQIQQMIADKSRFVKKSTAIASSSSSETIKAEEVMSNFQLFLMKEKSPNDDTFMLVFGLMDVFSRFVWLNVLSAPAGNVVLNSILSSITSQLERIFSEHGKPGLLHIQYEIFDEEPFLTNAVVEYCKKQYILCARSENPGLTDELVKNIQSDVRKAVEERNMNWVNEILKYTRELNALPRQELGWKNAFEMFHKRPYCFVPKQEVKTEEGPSHSRPTLIEVDREREECAGAMDNITEEEKSHPDNDKNTEVFLKHGFRIANNLPGAGSSQFSAVRQQLFSLGMEVTDSQIRSRLVSYLEQNHTNQDGFSLEIFTGVPWSEYLSNILSGSFNGDEITLEVLSNLYEVRIIVIDANKNQRKEINPRMLSSGDQLIRTIHVGYISDDANKGTYIALHQLEQVNAGKEANEDFVCSSATNIDSMSIIQTEHVDLPRLYISHPELLPRQNDGKIVTSVLALVNTCGSFSEAVQELKNVLNISLWKYAWLELLHEGMSWFLIKNIHFKRN